MADVTERYTCRQLFYVLSRKVKAEGGTVSVVRKSDLHIFPLYMHSCSSVGQPRFLSSRLGPEEKEHRQPN